MRNIFKLSKKRLFIMMLLISICWMFTANVSFAQNTSYQTLYIVGDKGGPIFPVADSLSDGLWAPGVTKSGIINLTNNYSERVRVYNLGLSIDLKKLGDGGYIDADIATLEEYLEKMELVVKRKVAGIFNTTVFSGSFKDMMFVKDETTRQGYNLTWAEQFNIGRNQFVELEYTVKMREDADNSLQGTKAMVSFLINSQENPTGSSGGGETEIPAPPALQEHWADDCITMLIAYGILIPDEDGNVRPDEYITRAETAELIARALGLEEKDKFFSGYLDPLPKKYRGFIIATTEAKVFRGYPGRLFLPNRNITREEMLCVLIRAFEIKLEGDIELVFKDAHEIGDWALRDVKAGVQNKIIGGYPDNTLRPKDNITRAEAFAIVCRLLGLHEEHSLKEVN